MNAPVASSGLEDFKDDLKMLEHALSHDLQAPVRGLRGLGKILQDKHGAQLTGEAGELVRLMGVEAERLSALFEGVLAWVQSGSRPLSCAWQNTEALARESFVTESSARPGLAVDLQLSPLPAVWSDATALRQIFRELLGNALKFSARRSPVAISISAQENPGETIVAVRDNGVGFDGAYAARKFHLFRRFHGRREFAGEGTGLAIVRQIVHRHGGRLWAEAHIDQGAVFYFALPKPPEFPAPPPL